VAIDLPGDGGRPEGLAGRQDLDDPRLSTITQFSPLSIT
jgi:hypothetical protein